MHTNLYHPNTLQSLSMLQQLSTPYFPHQDSIMQKPGQPLTRSISSEM